MRSLAAQPSLEARESESYARGDVCLQRMGEPMAGVPESVRMLPSFLRLEIVLAQQEGDWETSLEAALRYRKIAPQDVQGLCMLADVVRHRCGVAAGLQALLQGRAEEQKQPAVLFQKACYLTLLDQMDEARECIRIVLQMDTAYWTACMSEPDLAMLRQSGAFGNILAPYCGQPPHSP